MGKSIFKGWIDDNDPRYNSPVSVSIGRTFSLAGRPSLTEDTLPKPIIEAETNQQDIEQLETESTTS